MDDELDADQIEALASECERLAAAELSSAHKSIVDWGLDTVAIDRAIVTMDRAVRLREILGIVLAQQGVSPPVPNKGR